MGKAKEKLNKNIDKVMDQDQNISGPVFVGSFYAYIEERIKEWTKYVKQIKRYGLDATLLSHSQKKKQI